MTLYSILVTNNAPGCNTEIEQQLEVTGCTSYIVRLTSNSNALGPFNVFIDDVIYLSAVTRNEMLMGVVVILECGTPTPTPTITPTVTPTITPSPTFTPTPSATPGATPTPTETPTPTTTHTPTPSSTPQVFEILIITQDGEQLVTQNDNPLILQQEVTSFFVSSGESFCDDVVLTQTIYSNVVDWFDALRFYSDVNMTIPFNGGNLYYANTTQCGNCWQIDNDGFTSNLSNQPPC